MNEWSEEIPLITLLLGLCAALSIFSKWGLNRLRLPAAIGWIVIGILLRVVDSQWNWMTSGSREVFGVLGTLGVACLLFRVGMQCNIASLLSQLGRAVRIWCADFLLSGIIGFVAAYFVLGLSVPTSLIIATALTATSVGVSVIAWEQHKKLQTPNGQLMLDVAELDDVSGVVAMALLFALLPLWIEGGEGSFVLVIFETLQLFLLKMIAFGLVCFVFVRFIEKRLTDAFRRIHPPAEPLVLILAASLLIAGAAEYLGLSIAIGAFFAGVMFSSDSEHLRISESIDPLSAFITPFFFIGIGLDVELSFAPAVLIAGLVLSVAAIIGKVGGKFFPGMQLKDQPTAWLLGFSMIPRAEIAMIIVQRGQLMGEWAIPSHVFSAMVLVTIITCSLSPLVVHAILGRYPPDD